MRKLAINTHNCPWSAWRILHITMGILSLIELLLLGRFLSKTPDDFASLGWIFRILGWILKIIPSLMVIVHYVMGIMVIVQWFMIAGASWSDVYGTNAVIVWTILTFFWYLLHWGGAYLKGIMYSDPFWYKPDEPKITWFSLLCKKLGP